MSTLIKGFARCGKWIAKHWALTLAAGLLLAIGCLSLIFWKTYGENQEELVPVYVTVRGLPEGKNMEKREIMVKDGATVAEIFSFEYEEIFEQFLEPEVYNNHFVNFMEVTPEPGKRFDVRISGKEENNLTVAYTHKGAIIEITYR